MKLHKKQEGFTLIELLVVIAIIAILAVVVVLTLNPAELLRQARDSNRESDFATIKSAIGLYSADVATSTALNNGTDNLYASYTGASSSVSTYTGATNWGFSTGTVNTYLGVSTSTSRSINGSGWIPLNLSLISSGAPIGSWPVDPTNNGSYMYIYAASGTVYKIAAKMESSKYGYNGANDIVSTDGGNSSTTYEQGTNLSL